MKIFASCGDLVGHVSNVPESKPPGTLETCPNQTSEHVCNVPESKPPGTLETCPNQNLQARWKRARIKTSRHVGNVPPHRCGSAGLGIRCRHGRRASGLGDFFVPALIIVLVLHLQKI